jgi:hypothetical protein
MKRILRSLLLAIAFSGGVAEAQNGYTFFIRQTQMPEQSQWDLSVAQSGTRASQLSVSGGGARFDLWAVRSSPLTSYLVDSTYVNAYVPAAQVRITSSDPHSVIPRTRADKPFTVTITVSGLTADQAAQTAARQVKLLRHRQSYPATSDGSNIDRSQAILHSQSSLSSNGTHVLQYSQTVLPAVDGSFLKTKGEERFSVFSLQDGNSPESLLASQFVQVWPVSTVSIDGITSATDIKAKAPNVTVNLTDLYPDSVTYAQVYPGPPVLGTVGTTIPGASLIVKQTVPRNGQLFVWDWDNTITSDGQWTMEVLTTTPFGTERLAVVPFSVSRTIKVNGSVTSAD